METNKKTILPITGYGSPILREICVEAENKPETLNLIQNMIHTMTSIGTAVGLTANQVNSNLRVFTMNVYGSLTVVINPVVKKERGSKKSDEGCLSLPGVQGIVPNRPEIIEVEYYDYNFNKKKLSLRGFEAVVFLHEIDHLNGIFFTDRMTKEGQEAVKDKLSDISKGIYRATMYEIIFPNCNTVPEQTV